MANVPPAQEKRFWQRYVYLWINYALWEELAAHDSDRAREVYRAALRLIPHRSFTFGKVQPPYLLQAWSSVCLVGFCPPGQSLALQPDLYAAIAGCMTL